MANPSAKGSCLCGGITYEISEPLGVVVRVCGAVLITKFAGNPDVYGFALGTLDTDPGVKPAKHVFTRYKAPWYTITDDLPQIEDVDPKWLAVLERR